MVRSEGVRAPKQEAEATRRRLQELDVLRHDLGVVKEADSIWFPVAGCPVGLVTELRDFPKREKRAASYHDFLPAAWRHEAPRAFDQLGDIVIVKIPPQLWEERAAIGAALLRFKGARAAFHDAGVTGEFRVRELERIAGEGTTATTVQENGVALHVDPAAAYYSPRLGMERARVASMCQPGEHAIDLFGGVAPQGIQLAKMGATVDSCDLNPAACALAEQNAASNRVEDRVQVHCGDAREIAGTLPPADRLIMNLPHGARAFLDLVPDLLRPGGTLHYHEIMDRTLETERRDELSAFGTVIGTRVVRTYSTQDDHIVFDVTRSGA